MQTPYQQGLTIMLLHQWLIGNQADLNQPFITLQLYAVIGLPICPMPPAISMITPQSKIGKLALFNGKAKVSLIFAMGKPITAIEV